MEGFVIVAVFMVVVVVAGWVLRRGRGKSSGSAARGPQGVREEMRQRDEALFQSMFPELQPYYHPEKLVQFVRAHRERSRTLDGSAGYTWSRPPGFGVAAMAVAAGRERVLHELRDDAGTLLASFRFDEHPEGGVLRVGQGKLTVNVKEAVPRVRYWHPDREFKWSQSKGWTFVTRMADEPFSASDTTSGSSSSYGSPAQAAAAVAGVAAVAGAGGAFDGGGASQSWDEGGSGAGSSGGGSSDAFAGASASADSSSSSTSY